MIRRIFKAFFMTISAMSILGGCRYASPTAEDELLAEKAKCLAEKTEGTPGRHVGYYINNNYFGRRSIGRLSGERKATPEALEDARRSINKRMKYLELAQDWPEPISVKIPYASVPPVLDGNLNEHAWKNALTFEGVYPLNELKKQKKPATLWKVMWDKENIYFAAQCHDESIIAPKLERDECVFSYDSIEIFIMTDLQTGTYWEFIVSPSSCFFDALQTADRAGWRRVARVSKTFKGAETGVQIDGSLNNPGDRDKSFVIEIAMPFSELPGYAKGSKPKPGERLAFMMVRTDVSNKDDSVKYYAVQPLLWTCHNTWNYISAELVK